MIGSSSKAYLDPQIEARNRWARTNTAAYDLPPRRTRTTSTALPRVMHAAHARVVTVSAALLFAVLAFVVVVVLQASPSASQELQAPASGTISVTSGHGGGGTHFRML